ncbi:MAG: hypothetical protein JO197_00690 [Acidobacteria bacterium]|nr:hypothetical protein [Acidobacteriota bacterium]MBV9476369.1 hypothetical protein [Acidobacteriota bacterium]
MATKLAERIYQLTPSEGLSITVSAVGTGFLVVAGVNSTALSFPESGSNVRVTPEMLNGPGAMHTIDIRTFFTIGATPQAQYQIITVDDQGAVLDTTLIPILTTPVLPYQALTQVVVIIQEPAQ